VTATNLTAYFKVGHQRGKKKKKEKKTLERRPRLKQIEK